MTGLAEPSLSSLPNCHIPSEDKKASLASTTDALKGYLPTPQRKLLLDTRQTSRGGKK